MSDSLEDRVGRLFDDKELGARLFEDTEATFRLFDEDVHRRIRAECISDLPNLASRNFRQGTLCDLCLLVSAWLRWEAFLSNPHCLPAGLQGLTWS